jgi:precorrin-6y C5,15-methyltransferase (decarboxylating) CbiE subunit
MEKVFIVGMGPGSDDYVVPAAHKAIGEADVLVGSERLIHKYRKTGKTCRELKNNYSGMVKQVKRWSEKQSVAVLVSGDPCFYSLFGKLKEELPTEQFEVIPGITSIQLICARARVLWQDAVFLSVHGKPLEGLVSLVDSEKKAIVLTDNKNTPSTVARFCLDHGLTGRRVWVGKNLTYPDEAVYVTTFEELAKREEDGLCVLVIEEKGQPSSTG